MVIAQALMALFNVSNICLGSRVALSKNKICVEDLPSVASLWKPIYTHFTVQSSSVEGTIRFGG